MGDLLAHLRRRSLVPRCCPPSIVQISAPLPSSLSPFLPSTRPSAPANTPNRTADHLHHHMLDVPIHRSPHTYAVRSTTPLADDAEQENIITESESESPGFCFPRSLLRPSSNSEFPSFFVVPSRRLQGSVRRHKLTSNSSLSLPHKLSS